MSEIKIFEENEVVGKAVTIKMSDGSIWAAPLSTIIFEHCLLFIQPGDNIEEELITRTIPQYKQSPMSIIDDLSTHKNWSDVSSSFHRMKQPDNEVQYNEDFKNLSNFEIYDIAIKELEDNNA